MVLLLPQGSTDSPADNKIIQSHSVSVRSVREIIDNEEDCSIVLIDNEAEED